ncbi:MAG: IPT/TIG domain-containing protein, partial [Gammaproteobacteria bacterium]
ITVSGFGIPLDVNRVRVYVGDAQATVTDVQSNDTVERVGVISATVPAITEAGYYDVTIAVEKNGVWENDTLFGALAVDAPIRFDALTPLWGPVTGGTVITITGEGFEPGNTVSQGTRVRIGSIPVASINVISTTQMQIVAPGGYSGRHEVVGEDRYGNTTRLEGEEGFGYGLKLLTTTQAGGVSPTDIIVDQQTGVAITNGGYTIDLFKGGEGPFQVIDNIYFPDNLAAASFDIQDPLNPLLVGGSSYLPSGPEGQAALARHATAAALASLEILGLLTEEQQAELNELQGSILPMNMDSVRVLPVEEMEEGVLRKRLYVASGTGGVTRLNLDEQNGLQHLSQAMADNESRYVYDVLKWGNTVFAVAGQGSAEVEPPNSPCQAAGETDTTHTGLVGRINYHDPNDPVYLGEVDGLNGALSVLADERWLYAGGQASFTLWNTDGQCNQFRSASANKPQVAGTSTITATNLMDPALTREYLFAGNVADMVDYGDHLIVALTNGTVQIVEKARPDARTSMTIDSNLQRQGGRNVKLKLMGNLLFVSAYQGGVVVVDISNPEAPAVVSAGNTEHIEGLDIYKDRLLAASASGGMTVLQLPASMVMASSINEDGLITDNETLTLTFNEQITTTSLTEPGAVVVTRDDSGAPVPVTINPVNEINGHAQSFDLVFAHDPLVRYTVAVTDARNVRGTGLWRPYVLHVQGAAAGAQRPVIESVDGGVFHRGANLEQHIIGSGFRNDPAVKVYVDQYEVSHTWVDANTLLIPAGALELLPLELGDHQVSVVDSGLTSVMPGAILIGENLPLVQFALSEDTGSVKGGKRITISASSDAILPGAKVVMRSSAGVEIRTQEVAPGEFSPDLEEDVEDLSSLSFTLPGVVEPDLYEVYIDIEGTQIFVGNFSYTLEGGRDINLPNYPPMVIGGVDIVDDTMYVGVKDGEPPTTDNRFLMEHGFEIYDIAIWDQPIRLSQVRTRQPVNGVAAFGPSLYMASGSDGLLVADVHDPTNPLIVDSVAMPNNNAL